MWLLPIFIGLAFLAGAQAALFAQAATAMPGNKGFATIQEYLHHELLILS